MKVSLESRVVLLCLALSFSQQLSADVKMLIDNSKIIDTEPNVPYVINKNSIVLVGDFDINTTIQQVQMRMSVEANWESKSKSEYSPVNLVVRNNKKYIKIDGTTIPDDYFLMIRVNTTGVDYLGTYIIQAKAGTEIYDLKTVFTNPISLGFSFSVSLDDDRALGFSPLIYYQFHWINEGSEWWKHIAPSSLGLFLNPSLNDFTYSPDDLKALLTFGAGIGILDNYMIIGIAYDFFKNRYVGIIGLNITQ